MDYNEKYIFISDGTWYEKGTEVTVEDGNSLWRYDKGGGVAEITYEEMMEKPDRIGGTFNGWRICDSPISEGRKLGKRYMDGEVCGLDEFEIRKR